MNDLRQLLKLSTNSLCNGICECPQNNAAYKVLLDGDAPRAMQRFQRILSDRPRDADSLAGLAICLAETQGRFVSATKLARESVRLAPKSPSGYVALAYVHLLGSKLEAGYRYLMKAEQLAPSDPRISAGRNLFRRGRDPVETKPPVGNLLNRLRGGLRNTLQSPLHKVLALALLVEGAYLTGSILV